MPPRKKNPVTFDEWLGRIIDDETSTSGGRAAVASWIGASEQSVNRRARGEVAYLAREVQIIAARAGFDVDEIVNRALAKYGAGEDGMAKLIAEYASDAPPTVEDNITYLGQVNPRKNAAEDNPRTTEKD